MQRAWVFFWLLALIWGSSFLLMRIGVAQIPPAQLTFTRTVIAAVAMNITLLLLRKRYPTDRSTLIWLVVIGLGNTAIPFTLLAWGEQTVESGMTSVLQAITPVFALVIAHFTFADERITPLKIMGIALSFGGIVVLTSRDWAAGQGFGGDLSGEIAILVASFCYGLFTNVSRKTLRDKKVEPVVVAAVSMTAAAVSAAVMMYTLPLLGERAPVSYASLTPEVLRAGVVLGVLNTFVAYLMFYYVIEGLGAARAAMVTYVVPVVAVTLGALFLNEMIDATLLLGSALILAGIALVNLRLLQRRAKLETPLAQQPEKL
ncbi:MAG: DMT family transporter [Chloroflexi bacterium]|nr:DMT family transporter [Chloroflexota bacterium]